ncbi:LuxR C-terminal-related transcriptional regulator [Streptomyces sp. NPDC048241]|uniref:helix-turn-helix transcriptional regulator n=1 Tax=Streptomyces sp. NPDC048241 TaxID=3365521 RepID=UPI003721895E
MPLAEQARPLAELTAALAEVTRGGGGVTVVSGGVGCGRTELLHALRSVAVRAGYAVLRATGSRPERDTQGGVLGQLSRYADLPEGHRDALAPYSFPSGADGSVRWPPDRATGAALHELTAVLLRLAERVPVLLCVDDLDLADSLSLYWISRLVPQLRAARIHLVVAECTTMGPAHPLPHAELRRDPRYRQVVLAGIAPGDVATLLADSLGDAAARTSAADCYRVTGGNPLLLRALVTDQRHTDATSAGTPPTGPVVARAYGDAVLALLHRAGPTALALAQILAVLDEADTDTGLVARLLDEPPAPLTEWCRDLAAAGLLDGTRLRHPVGRAAVLRSLDAPARRALHRRAAELLHAAGADAARIAPHLLAAAPVDEPWAPAVLDEAARRHLTADRLQEARDCFGAALAVCHDESERTLLEARLAATARLLDPALGTRHIADLATTLNGDLLPGRHALALARHLLWHGRFDEAATVVRRAVEQAGTAGADPAAAAEADATRHLLATIHPPVLVSAAGTGGDPRVRAAAALSEVLARGPATSAVAAAESALRGMRLGRSTSEWIVCAVTALLYAERIESADRWCTHWLTEARTRRVPLWEAELSSVLAGVRRRQGDPAAARDLAEAALARVPVESWGVTIGQPLSHLVEAATDSGDQLAAEEHLAVPVPDAMYDTRFGLHLLHARGRHRLETGRADEALEDFTACADLMRRWGCDQPALAPWRTGAARAHLAWGDPSTARALAQEQLDMAGPLPTRTRGLTLRVLADTEYGTERVGLLTEAVAVLRTAGDRLQTAGALADLARDHLRAGRTGRARTGLATAARLAGRCGAGPLAAALAAEAETLAPRGGDPTDRTAVAGPLSAAERRVASLAADGHTNKEIAWRLRITVSTVEQHLTRIFRKLGVRARRDLAPALASDAARPVPTPRDAAPAGLRRAERPMSGSGPDV